MICGSLYGNYRQKKFCEVYDNADTFRSEYQSCGLPDKLNNAGSLDTIFYLLYAHYGNSTIASSDTNRFKYQLFSIIFMYGPTWEKELEVQDVLRSLSQEDLTTGTTQINNHALNPETTPSTNAFDPLNYINEQVGTRYKKGKVEAYANLMIVLKKDVTKEFIEKFRKLFLTIVRPELPLWYETDIETEGEDE